MATILLAGCPGGGNITDPGAWEKSFSGRTGWDVQETIDGGYVIIGTTGPGVVIDAGPFLMKTDAVGTTLWSTPLSTAGFDAVSAFFERSDGSFIVCARTDARSVDGLGAAIERAHAYVEAGARMIFPEGLESEDEFARFADELNKLCAKPPYLLANMTEFGKTPIIPLARFGEMGYHVVIFPVSTLRTAMGAVVKLLTDLKATGSVTNSIDGMQNRSDLYALLGYDPQGEGWEYPSH